MEQGVFKIHFLKNFLFTFLLISLSMPLPTGNFIVIDEERELSEMNLSMYDPMGNLGFIINADWEECPKEIRKKTNKFPLMPEHFLVKENYLSQMQKDFFKDRKFPEQKKLTATFCPRDNYTCSLLNYQWYLKMGMKIKKLNWVVQFTQAAIFKSFVEKCTALRNSTDILFLQMIAKLMVNAVSEIKYEFLKIKILILM